MGAHPQSPSALTPAAAPRQCSYQRTDAVTGSSAPSEAAHAAHLYRSAPSTLVVSARFEDDGAARWAAGKSKRAPLRESSVDAIAREAAVLIMSLASGRSLSRLGITCISITADGFRPISQASRGCLVGISRVSRGYLAGISWVSRYVTVCNGV